MKLQLLRPQGPDPLTGALLWTHTDLPFAHSIYIYTTYTQLLATPRPCNDYSCYGALEIVGAITITIIITVATHLVVVLVGRATVLESLRLRRFKRDRGEIWQIVLQVNRHQSISEIVEFLIMTSKFQDGGHDVISRRKVLPLGEFTCSHMQHIPGAHAAALCQYLIYTVSQKNGASVIL